MAIQKGEKGSLGNRTISLLFKNHLTLFITSFYVEDIDVFFPLICLNENKKTAKEVVCDVTCFVKQNKLSFGPRFPDDNYFAA